MYIFHIHVYTQMHTCMLYFVQTRQNIEMYIRMFMCM